MQNTNIGILRKMGGAIFGNNYNCLWFSNSKFDRSTVPKLMELLGEPILDKRKGCAPGTLKFPELAPILYPPTLVDDKSHLFKARILVDVCTHLSLYVSLTDDVIDPTHPTSRP